MLPRQALQVYIHTCKFGFARMYDKVLYYPGLVPFLQSNTDQSRGMCECACVCWGWRQWGRGARWWWIDGVNTPAYMDWANIQFVPSRLSSTVAATQFLPIDLSATGTITPRDTTSPEYGAASSQQPAAQAWRWRSQHWKAVGIEPTTRRKWDELESGKKEAQGGERVNLFCGVVAVTKHKHLEIS